MKRKRLPPGPATCAHVLCGRPFVREGHIGGHFRIYCKRGCQSKAAEWRKRQERPPRVHKRVCVGCRKRFRTEDRRQKYCERECRQEAYRQSWDSPYYERLMRKRASVHFPVDMAREIRALAAKKGRAVSWLLQQAWRRARKAIRAMQPQEEPGERMSRPLLGRPRRAA